MNISRRYVELFKVDTDDIKNIKSFVDNLTEEQWNDWNFRQKNFDQHKKTKTYPLGWATDLENGSYEVLIKHKQESIWDILSPHIQHLENSYSGRCVNIMFANLPAGEKIKRHMDISDLLKSVHRCHLPILTNEDVIFYIGKKPLNLKEGIFYEINNQLIHSVENNSSEDRVHLIIDILPFSSNINLKFTCE